MAGKEHKEREADRLIRGLRKYFDEVAWKQREGGKWTDTELEVSPTKLNDWYAYKEHMRNRNHLKGRGLYFLDAGCGARPYGVYAAGYRHHVCVDFSITGLKGARESSGDSAYYIQADIRQLPFKSGVFEGSCSPYVIYHIPGLENQKKAFRELHRVLQEGCSGIVIYDNPNHLGTKLRRWARRAPWLQTIITRFTKKPRKSMQTKESVEILEAIKAREDLLHYEPLPSATILKFIADENALRIKTHSLLTEPAKKAWLKDNIFWNIILRCLLTCESLAGGFLFPIAPVWCVVIRKNRRRQR